MAFCLIPQLADKLKRAIGSGEINLQNLMSSTSVERRKMFEKIIGSAEEAKKINAFLESKLILKDQQRGLITWAESLTGLKEPAKRDLISRIGRMDKILTPATEKQFLQDLASKRLGLDVTAEEAKTLMKMSNTLEKAKLEIGKDGTSKKYGIARQAMKKYIGELKLASKHTSIGEHIVDIAGATKAVNATLDNSALFRQGWKTLWTNPITWGQNAAKSWTYIGQELKGKDAMDGILSNIYSKKYSIDGTFDKMKLDIGNAEEAFPTTLPEKVPGLKRLYKASESAYSGFLYTMRADIAERMLDMAKKQGIDITDKKQVEAIGRLVNSMTGRGTFGKYSGNWEGLANNIFFSPKFLKSQFDTVGHIVSGAGGSNFVRKQAAYNLLKVAAGTAAVLVTAERLHPGSVEWNPTSSKFGKIQIGNTSFNVTGGMGSLVTFIARLGSAVLGKDIKSSSGQMQKLNSGFGSTTGMDIINNFWEGKLSPLAGVARDIVNQKDFSGNPVTLKGILASLLVPMPIKTGVSLKTTPGAAPFELSMLADALGISTNTRQPQSSSGYLENISKSKYANLKERDTVVMNRFREQLGVDKFKEADNFYQEEVSRLVNELINKDAYKKMAEPDKVIELKKAKDIAEKNTLKKFGYKAPKSTPDRKYLTK